VAVCCCHAARTDSGDRHSWLPFVPPCQCQLFSVSPRLCLSLIQFKWSSSNHSWKVLPSLNQCLVYPLCIDYEVQSSISCYSTVFVLRVFFRL
jgi:hypothetical protein